MDIIGYLIYFENQFKTGSKEGSGGGHFASNKGRENVTHAVSYDFMTLILPLTV